MRLHWLAHDEAPGPCITIPQYWFDKTKQHTSVVSFRVKLSIWWVMVTVGHRVDGEFHQSPRDSCLFLCLLLQPHRLFVCSGLSAFSFFLGVSRGQQLTRHRRAPLEIPKLPRATRSPTRWGMLVCESGIHWSFGCTPLPDGSGSVVRVEGLG